MAKNDISAEPGEPSRGVISTQCPTFKQPAHSQSQSLLFRLIPLEIRWSIWQFILDSWGWGSAIHIVTTQHLASPLTAPWLMSESEDEATEVEHVRFKLKQKLKLTHIPCAESMGDPFLISGTHYGHWPRGHLACSQLAKWRMEGANGEEGHGNLQMLETCQRMYEEMTEMLYPSLRFDFLGLTAANTFLSRLTLSTAAKLRTLHLELHTKSDAELPVGVQQHHNHVEYARRRSRCGVRQETWDLSQHLSTIPALKELKVVVYDNDYIPTPENFLLRPFMRLQLPLLRPEKFVVELSARPEAGADEAGGSREAVVKDVGAFAGSAPFTIIRRGQDVFGHLREVNIGALPRPAALVPANVDRVSGLAAVLRRIAVTAGRVVTRRGSNEF